MEARRQFYTNKLSGGQTNQLGTLDNQPLISANNNSNNSNAIDSFAIDTNDDFVYADDPSTTMQKSTTQVGEDMQSVLKHSGVPPIHSDHGFYHNTLGPRSEGKLPL